jgi:hypothetical protein
MPAQPLAHRISSPVAVDQVQARDGGRHGNRMVMPLLQQPERLDPGRGAGLRDSLHLLAEAMNNRSLGLNAGLVNRHEL